MDDIVGDLNVSDGELLRLLPRRTKDQAVLWFLDLEADLDVCTGHALEERVTHGLG
jgi:hypothetical protein